jgi:hypothetical protein
MNSAVWRLMLVLMRHVEGLSMEDSVRFNEGLVVEAGSLGV